MEAEEGCWGKSHTKAWAVVAHGFYSSVLRLNHFTKGTLKYLWLCVMWEFSAATHMAMSVSSASKLQLSKGISGILWGVLPAVPLGDNCSSKVVSSCHRVMHLLHTTTLTQGSITDKEHKKHKSCYSVYDSVSNTLSHYKSIWDN